MSVRFQAWVLACLSVAGPARSYSVCVDPGHGGDGVPGAVGCDLIEAEVNLDTALRLAPLLEAADVEVILTRETDTNVSLTSRVAYANSVGVDRYISIHANSNEPPPGSGIETLRGAQASSASRELSELILEEMVATWPLPDRGVKVRSDLYVLNATHMPAMLTELAFINNCEVDALYLADPDQRQRAAEAHRDAILAHLGMEVPVEGEVAGVVYRDLGDGGADTSQRLPGALVKVVETGAALEASPEAAAWQFELPPGTYTVSAELAGFQLAERVCEISAGTTTWCSLGLVPEARDAGVRDAGVILDAADPEAADPEDAARPDARCDRCSEGSVDHSSAELETAPGCDCGASPGAPDRGLVMLGAALLFGAGRRGLRGARRRC